MGDIVCIKSNYQPFSNHPFKGMGGFLQDPFDRHRNLNTTEVNRASILEQKSADIDLVTAEGDRVTISLNSLHGESYSSYNSKGYVNGMISKVQMEAFRSVADSEALITLEGDLNEEELADIQTVLGKIESLAGDFFSGAIDEIAAEGIQFDDMGSVVGLQASLDHSYTLSVEQQYMAKITGIPSEQPGTFTEKERPITGDKVRTLIDNMTKAVEESRVMPKKMTKVLPSFIDHLFDKHLVEDDAEGTKRDLAKLIQSDFLRRLPEEMKPDGLPERDDLEDVEES
ncbi:MAG: hypothetical protein SVY10_07865 [Thermodesulfobacteriota bacterium]|nr:hypothetical protein [Thermodesulfobacteriota bacterium]